jgi:HAD superfamily hydrolase (TIGR01509 family)
MKVKALIFDFDGLILDTETPEVDVWTEIYSEYGFEFPIDQWAQIIGGYGISDFNAAEHLHQINGDSPDITALRLRHQNESYLRVLSEPLRAGVMDYLSEARRLNLKLAIASSSSHEWVDAHLARLGLIQYFDKVICSDNVPLGRTKPNPDLFLKALEQLQVRADEAIVFEDSPNGVKAANRAGIFVVAVPNPLTARLPIEGEGLKLRSMADLPLSTLLTRINL